MNQRLFDQLGQVARLAGKSRIGRLLHHPFRYLSAIYFWKISYARNRQEKIVETILFSGRKMHIALPASTDIYLTGGKSHDSEIRLARFLIRHLGPGEHFLDIGAHYGYFTLLAAELVGAKGQVQAYEPAGKTFSLLQQNTRDLAQVMACRKAVSDSSDNLVFYEFANLQSEYNALDVRQFEQENWFREAPPAKVEVPGTTIDHITAADKGFSPAVIKIDVEGAEHQVIAGGQQFLSTQQPMVVMEYLEPKRHNQGHKQALLQLAAMGYGSYRIDAAGILQPVQDIDAYLQQHGLDSDNIVFCKKPQAY